MSANWNKARHSEDFQNVINNNKDVTESRLISPRWDLSQERMYVEELVNKRTGFLLIFFGLSANAFINARFSSSMQLVIALMSLVVSIAVSLAIFRAQKKLDIILGLIFNDSTHPITVVDKIADRPLSGTGSFFDRWNEIFASKSRRHLIGWGLPLACVIPSLLGVAYALTRPADIPMSIITAQPPARIEIR